jgi:hypothetical protein
VVVVEVIGFAGELGKVVSVIKDVMQEKQRGRGEQGEREGERG